RSDPGKPGLLRRSRYFNSLSVGMEQSEQLDYRPSTDPPLIIEGWDRGTAIGAVGGAKMGLHVDFKRHQVDCPIDVRHVKPARVSAAKTGVGWDVVRYFFGVVQRPNVGRLRSGDRPLTFNHS